MADSLQNDKLGHRQRVRQRFLDGGVDRMADYELLEFLLMQTIPRRDVKPIAKELLRRFGTFADVIYASPADLMQTKWVKENTCALFKVINSAIKRVCLYKMHDEKNLRLATIDSVVEYCRACIGFAAEEELHVVMLDASCQLIGVELIQRGSLTGVTVSPRDIITVAMNKKAASIVLIHNHPSCNTKPSDADIYTTGRIEDACQLLGIKLQDHIIISKSEYFSFREHRMLFDK